MKTPKAATDAGKAPRGDSLDHFLVDCGQLSRYKGNAPRKFKLTLTDNDGEVHEYNVSARNPWEVLNFASSKMTASGDFYGHTLDMAMDISVAELIQDANGDFIIL